MEVLEGLKKFMKDNGYDGLLCCEGECACDLGDFMPCGNNLDCNAEFIKILKCEDCKKENNCVKEKDEDEDEDKDYKACRFTSIEEYNKYKK